MSEFEKMIKSLTSNWFLSLKKIVNYAFPDRDTAERNITDNDWIQTMAYLAPIMAVGILFFICLNPPPFFAVFPALGSLLHFAAVAYTAFFVFFMLFCSLILKIKRKSPHLLLTFTLYAPLKIFLAFGVLNFAFTVSGFGKTAKELGQVDRRLAEAAQKIQEEKSTLKSEIVNAETEFTTKFNDTRKQLRASNKQFHENFDKKVNSFKEAFEEDWKARDVRWAETRRQQAELMRIDSDKFKEEMAKPHDTFQRNNNHRQLTEEEKAKLEASRALDREMEKINKHFKEEREKRDKPGEIKRFIWKQKKNDD